MQASTVQFLQHKVEKWLTPDILAVKILLNPAFKQNTMLIRCFFVVA
jgi:hypothetical protein